MLITNNTDVDYWLGPIRLPASASGFSFDDTSETSLYLLDDDVADAVNTLSSSGAITCTDTNTPFPRPTGVPQVLHGDGSPEGLVYATQASLYMRRDNSSAWDTLYVKVSGVEENTGWAVMQLTPASVGTTFPVSPAGGQIFQLAVGDTEMQFIYDGSHWYSSSFTIPVLANGSVNTTNGPTQVGSGATVAITDQTGAGCSVQARVVGVISGAYTGTLGDDGEWCNIGLDMLCWTESYDSGSGTGIVGTVSGPSTPTDTAHYAAVVGPWTEVFGSDSGWTIMAPTAWISVGGSGEYNCTCTYAAVEYRFVV